MRIEGLIKQLEDIVVNPGKGLPEELFLFVSRVTPLVNVDLLKKNELGHTLLTWRDDGYCPAGWHIPGGILRHKELFAQRINAVAASELGARVSYNKDPVTVNEIIIPSMINRGHGISFLYECTLTCTPDNKLKYINGAPDVGEWAWYDKCPDNLISVHEMYRKYI